MEPFPHKTHKFNYAKWRESLKILEAYAASIKAKWKLPHTEPMNPWDLYRVKAEINWLLELRAWAGGKFKLKMGDRAYVLVNSKAIYPHREFATVRAYTTSLHSKSNLYTEHFNMAYYKGEMAAKHFLQHCVLSSKNVYEYIYPKDEVAQNAD
jgi:hypothetical protein